MGSTMKEANLMQIRRKRVDETMKQANLMHQQWRNPRVCYPATKHSTL